MKSNVLNLAKFGFEGAPKSNPDKAIVNIEHFNESGSGYGLTFGAKFTLRGMNVYVCSDKIISNCRPTDNFRICFEIGDNTIPAHLYKLSREDRYQRDIRERIWTIPEEEMKKLPTYAALQKYTKKMRVAEWAGNGASERGQKLFEDCNAFLDEYIAAYDKLRGFPTPEELEKRISEQKELYKIRLHRIVSATADMFTTDEFIESEHDPDLVAYRAERIAEATGIVSEKEGEYTYLPQSPNGTPFLHPRRLWEEVKKGKYLTDIISHFRVNFFYVNRLYNLSEEDIDVEMFVWFSSSYNVC